MFTKVNIWISNHLWSVVRVWTWNTTDVGNKKMFLKWLFYMAKCAFRVRSEKWHKQCIKATQSLFSLIVPAAYSVMQPYLISFPWPKFETIPSHLSFSCLHVEISFVSQNSPSCCRKCVMHCSCFALVIITWGLTSCRTIQQNDNNILIQAYVVCTHNCNFYLSPNWIVEQAM